MDKKSPIKKKKTSTSIKSLKDAFTGETLTSADAIRFDGGHFHRRDAIRGVNGNIYSKKDDRVTKDYYSDIYIIKESSYPLVIDIEESSNTPVIGYTVDRSSMIPIHGIRPIAGPHHSFTKFVSSTNIALKLGLVESMFDGVWYKKGSSFKPPTGPIPYREFKFPDFNNKLKSDQLKYGSISPTYRISENKRYSMGIELETSGGLIPKYARRNLNIACVYDGSIRDDNGNKRIGGEYVTGVLRGDNGFRHLYKITTELSKRCSLNNTCSVHVHLGGLQFTKEDIVLLWKINQFLEAELFSMMPKSREIREHCHKMKAINFNFKQSNKPIDVIFDEYFNKIFKIVSLGKSPSRTVNKKFNHPAGPRCGYDTNTPRYWWINFVPAMFNLKGEDNYTIEYRMHSASLNFTKIKNWILICMGITYVAENHKKFVMDAKKITLDDVIKLAYPTKAKYLISYIEERKTIFSKTHLASSLNEKAEYIVDRTNTNSNKTIKDAAWD